VLRLIHSIYYSVGKLLWNIWSSFPRLQKRWVLTLVLGEVPGANPEGDDPTFCFGYTGGLDMEVEIEEAWEWSTLVWGDEWEILNHAPPMYEMTYDPHRERWGLVIGLSLQGVGKRFRRNKMDFSAFEFADKPAQKR
jgi:hypothetical protein